MNQLIIRDILIVVVLATNTPLNIIDLKKIMNTKPSPKEIKQVKLLMI